MYIEFKGNDVTGPARIGRVTFSKSGRTLYYRDQAFRKCNGYIANHLDAETGEEYWISGCKKKGGDRLYPGIIEIDEDVRAEYWTDIRDLPERADQATIRCRGKYGGKKG